MFAVKLYLSQNKIEEAKNLLDQHLTEFKSLNPEIQLLELYILSQYDRKAATKGLKELISLSH